MYRFRKSRTNLELKVVKNFKGKKKRTSVGVSVTKETNQIN